MGKKDTHVKHEGTITQIDGATVHVRIIQHSACAGCHVKSACTAADRSEKIIETICHLPGLYVGQPVWVVGTEAMSNEALRLAFMYPFAVVCCVLAVCYYLTGDEGVSGTAALLSLLPYYLALYLMRKKIKKSLVFTVEPQKAPENL